MAQHPIWRGHLRLALVSCPVGLYTAHAAKEELHFHFINPKTNNRVHMQTLDAGTNKEVQRGDLVKGYEFKKDTYVILDDADFERAKIDSSTVLAVDKFVAADAIDPAGRVALSRLVIARRERAVAIMPMGHGLVLHTLHDEKDMHDPQELFAGVPGAKPDPAMVRLATQLIDRQTSRFDPADMEDRYEARLREVIEAKLRGEDEMPEAAPDEDRSNVVDLMAALKRSLAQGSDKPKRAAKKPAAKPAAKSGTPVAAKAKQPVNKPPAARKPAAAPARKRA